jgi:uncharacterized damage-inducible protein DinB
MKDDLIALHVYNRWADGKVVESLQPIAPEQYVKEVAPGWPSLRSSLIHIAGATCSHQKTIAGTRSNVEIAIFLRK